MSHSYTRITDFQAIVENFHFNDWKFIDLLNLKYFMCISWYSITEHLLSIEIQIGRLYRSEYWLIVNIFSTVQFLHPVKERTSNNSSMKTSNCKRSWAMNRIRKKLTAISLRTFLQMCIIWTYDWPCIYVGKTMNLCLIKLFAICFLKINYNFMLIHRH